MNIKSIITILLLLPAGLCMAQDKFEILGTLSAIDKDKIVILDYKNSQGKDARDTAIVKNGNFALSGITAFGNKAYLSLVNAKKDSIRQRTISDNQLFYLEKGKYRVTGTSSIEKATIKGGQAQNDYLLYNSQMDTLSAHYKVLVERYMKAKSAKDDTEIKRIQAEGKPLGIRMESALNSFIFSHPDSYVSLDLIFLQKTDVIDSIVFEPFYKALSKRVLASFTGQKLTAKYDKAKQISVGKVVDFTQRDDKGNEFKLSSLKGKYVLVDFWASWCVPCRAENPYLLKAYNQLKDKNFEIVGVSLDETKAAWLNAVKNDAMPWVQVSDLKGFKSELAVKYGIAAIPQNFLINPEGVIIGKNLRGEDVNEKIASFIK